VERIAQGNGGLTSRNGRNRDKSQHQRQTLVHLEYMMGSQGHWPPIFNVFASINRIGVKRTGLKHINPGDRDGSWPLGVKVFPQNNMDPVPELLGK
jgi:hypothetical protein